MKNKTKNTLSMVGMFVVLIILVILFVFCFVKTVELTSKEIRKEGLKSMLEEMWYGEKGKAPEKEKGEKDADRIRE